MSTSFEKLKQKQVQTPESSTETVGAFESLKKKGVSQTAEVKPKKSFIRKVGEFIAPTTTGLLTGEKDVSARSLIGAGLELGSFAIPVGGVARGIGLAGKGALTLGKKAALGAATGGVTGATFGSGQAIAEGKDVGGIAKEALTTGAFGAVGGAALPVGFAGASRAFGGVKSKIAQRGAEKIEQKSLLKSGAPDSRVATKKIVDSKVVTDKVAQEAVKQGIEEADVALIKTANKIDKSKMAKMLDIRERQITNRRVTERATDVAGDTYIENVAKFLESKNKEAGKGLNVVAKKLSGKKVDLTEPIQSFTQELDNIGITLNSKGGLNFKGSAFEDVPAVQSSIKNVWNRMIRVAGSGDALESHRLKSYIDSIVDYGVEGGGLKGNASRILKGFRRNVDGVLDTTFPEYNAINTQYTDTIGQMSKIASLMGKKFRVGDKFADARMGILLRRILSNTQSRSEILRLLDESQKVAKLYGAKFDDDVINQVYFADILEKMFGSEAPTSFLGQGERFAAKTQGLVEGISLDKPIKSAVNLTKFATDLTRGISQENRIKALKQLIGEFEKKSINKTTKPKTTSVFGKKKIVSSQIPKNLESEARFYIREDIPLQRKKVNISDIRGAGLKSGETVSHVPESAINKPVFAVKINNKLQLLDGRHRIEILKSRGLKTVDVIFGDNKKSNFGKKQ